MANILIRSSRAWIAGSLLAGVLVIASTEGTAGLVRLLYGAAMAVVLLSLLVLFGGASTIELDASGLTLRRLWWSTHVLAAELERVECVVREPLGGRRAAFQVLLFATSQKRELIPKPTIWRVDGVRRATANHAAARLEEWCHEVGTDMSISRPK